MYGRKVVSGIRRKNLPKKKGNDVRDHGKKFTKERGEWCQRFSLIHVKFIISFTRVNFIASSVQGVTLLSNTFHKGIITWMNTWGDNGHEPKVYFSHDSINLDKTMANLMFTFHTLAITWIKQWRTSIVNKLLLLKFLGSVKSNTGRIKIGERTE